MRVEVAPDKVLVPPKNLLLVWDAPTVTVTTPPPEEVTRGVLEAEGAEEVVAAAVEVVLVGVEEEDSVVELHILMINFANQVCALWAIVDSRGRGGGGGRQGSA